VYNNGLASNKEPEWNQQSTYFAVNAVEVNLLMFFVAAVKV
jgi:hypothetical protein